VRLSELVSGAPQLTLFDDNTELTSLYDAMDRIKNRFGENAIHHST
jgi:DNA polymerase-4